jgi:hypothetical protein
MPFLFDSVSVPVRCPCDKADIPTRLVSMLDAPVSLTCPSCGQTYTLDVRESARTLMERLEQHGIEQGGAGSMSQAAERPATD